MPPNSSIHSYSTIYTYHKILILSSFLPLFIDEQSMANVVELKVGLHCDECIKKILKAIKKIEDIESYDVDTQYNKVTVTGNVTTEKVIRVLQKIGKHATTWDESFTANY
ncbi:copper transport protein ATX1-like [Salvia splendens]|nr:copper transport protein ATX1-like [Salvia splendens]